MIEINAPTQEAAPQLAPRSNPTAAEIEKALNRYPYFVRISDASEADVAALIDSLRALDSPPTTVSRIEVDLKKVAEAESTGATRLSRSAVAMEAHTDSTFAPRPHEVIALHFIRPAAEGGDTIVAPIDDILAVLDAETVAWLEKTSFQFNKISAPVLDHGRIRFNWVQMEKSAGPSGISEADAPILDNLRDAVDRASITHQFRAEAGEIVLINNRRALHSRTAFSPGSDRLMMRYRFNSDRID